MRTSGREPENETGGDVQASIIVFSSFKSIREGAADLLQRFPTIDSPVLNAGVALPLYTLSDDGYELQFATKHLGDFLLTDLLLPGSRPPPIWARSQPWSPCPAAHTSTGSKRAS